jgi:hypothetical protein
MPTVYSLVILDVAMTGRRCCALVLGAAAAAYAPNLRASDALPQAEGPCGPLLAHLATLMPDGVLTPQIYVGDGLTGYLQRDDKEPRAILARASPACRAEIRREPAGRLASFVRDALARREAGWVNVGRILACAFQDPAHLSAVPEWLAAEGYAEARAACFSTLGTWPGAEAVRSAAFARAVRNGEQGWYVDPALLSVVGQPDRLGPEARDQLAPVVRIAQQRRADGFDSLRAGVCVPNERWSAERAQMCGEASATAEARWREQREGGRRWAIRLGATVPYVGAVAAAYAARDSDLGLGIATGAGALAGASAGVLLGIWAAMADADPDFVEVSMVVGGVLLGTLGGIAAHAAVDDSPGWRAPLTGAALLVPLTIVWGSAGIW